MGTGITPDKLLISVLFMNHIDERDRFTGSDYPESEFLLQKVIGANVVFVIVCVHSELDSSTFERTHKLLGGIRTARVYE